MRTFTRDSAPPLLMAVGLLLVGVVLGLLLARGLDARPGSELAAGPTNPSATPSPASTLGLTPSSTPATGTTPSPSAMPSRTAPPSPPMALASTPPEAAAVVAIWQAAERLGALHAYRFTVGLGGRSPLRLDEPSGSSIAIRGSLINQPVLAVDAVVGTQMVEFDGNAGTSFSQRFVLIGDTIWTPRSGESPKPEPAADNLTELRLLLPDGVVERLIVPYAAGFERAGSGHRNGVATIHYRLSEHGVRVYATATSCDGTWTGDLWVAEVDGYLVAAELRCAVPAASGSESGFQVQLDVTDANDPTIVIKPLS